MSLSGVGPVRYTLVPTRMLTLLTCSQCSAGAELRRRLHQALRQLGLKPVFSIVDVASLPRTDPRIGYPAPTVMWRERDLFGIPEVPAPYPPPT